MYTLGDTISKQSVLRTPERRRKRLKNTTHLSSQHYCHILRTVFAYPNTYKTTVFPPSSELSISVELRNTLFERRKSERKQRKETELVLVYYGNRNKSENLKSWKKKEWIIQILWSREKLEMMKVNWWSYGILWILFFLFCFLLCVNVEKNKFRDINAAIFLRVFDGKCQQNELTHFWFRWRWWWSTNFESSEHLLSVLWFAQVKNKRNSGTATATAENFRIVWAKLLITAYLFIYCSHLIWSIAWIWWNFLNYSDIQAHSTRIRHIHMLFIHLNTSFRWPGDCPFKHF